MVAKATRILIVPAMYGRGKMRLREIYFYVERVAKANGIKLSPHWKATVRNTLQRHCRGNAKYRKPNYFHHVRRGVWECRV